jgi:hypothetical protein
MLRSMLCLTILCTGTVYGAVKHVPIRSGVVLNPGEAYTAQVESAKLVEIEWTLVQPKKCTMDCVEMTPMSGTLRRPSFSAATGAIGKYTPTDGKLAVEFKNISQEPVTIDVTASSGVARRKHASFSTPARRGTGWFSRLMSSSRSRTAQILPTP